MNNQPLAGRIITPPPERWRDALIVAVPPKGRASLWRAILVASPDGRLATAEPVAVVATARTYDDLVTAVHAEAVAMDDADRRGVATALGYGGASDGLFALARWSIDRLLGTGPAAAVRVRDVALDMAGPGGVPIPGARKAARKALDAYRDTDGRALVTARVGGSTVWARTHRAAAAAATEAARENGDTTRRPVPVQVSADLWAAAVKASRTERTARRAVYRELDAAATGAWPVPPAPTMDGPDDPDAAGPISVWYVPATVVVALEAAHGAGCVPRAIRAAVRRVAEGGQG